MVHDGVDNKKPPEGGYLLIGELSLKLRPYCQNLKTQQFS